MIAIGVSDFSIEACFFVSRMIVLNLAYTLDLPVYWGFEVNRELLAKRQAANTPEHFDA